MEKNFYTVAEIASILKLTNLTIYKYIHEGSLEAVQFGGHYRIEKRALDQFIQSHTVSIEQSVNPFYSNKEDKNG